MNNKKRMADLWTKWSKDDNAYFEVYSTGLDQWNREYAGPNLNSNLDCWRVVFPPKEWIPERYDWHVYYDGRIFNESNDFINNSMTRKNEKQACKLSQKLMTVARLSAWIDENGYGREFQQGSNDNCYVYQNNGKWVYNNNYSCTYPDRVIMSREGAEKLVKLLDNGEVKL